MIYSGHVLFKPEPFFLKHLPYLLCLLRDVLIAVNAIHEHLVIKWVDSSIDTVKWSLCNNLNALWVSTSSFSLLVVSWLKLRTLIIYVYNWVCFNRAAVMTRVINISKSWYIVGSVRVAPTSVKISWFNCIGEMHLLGHALCIVCAQTF